MRATWGRPVVGEANELGQEAAGIRNGVVEMFCHESKDNRLNALKLVEG